MSVSTPAPPLDWPHYGIGFIPAVKRVFQKYATFTGRASRGEYWWWVLAAGIIGTVLYVLFLTLGIVLRDSGNVPIGTIRPIGYVIIVVLIIFGLATIVPTIAVTIRRLHDAGFSGWFYLFSVVGLGIVVTILCILPTSPNAAQYGPPAPQPNGPGYPPQPGYGQQPPYGQQ